MASSLPAHVVGLRTGVEALRHMYIYTCVQDVHLQTSGSGRLLRAEMASSEGNTQTYKMASLDHDINQHLQDAMDVIQQHSHNPYYDQDYKYYETLVSQQSPIQCQFSCCLVTHSTDIPAPAYDWSDTAPSWPQVMPDVSLSHSVQNESPHFYSILPPQRNSKGRKKLRLYEYLHEALNDPSMGDSIQWTDSGSGTFHFISKNKEKLAECWGQRKGNRKTMTYQKMARALRNYSRTGEIVKVRRKLTYQFNPDILNRLGSAQVPVRLPCPPAQEDAHGQQEKASEQSYCGAATTDWHGWYGQYQLQEDYELGSGFSSHTLTKL
ncbi:transcription factor Spi-C [Austrofundulus limnaeus]|uniref:Transcription factor Spi-C n=1 Tax=Austrofundulus limnaeus TaxID=52670 RepID=A0A2I4AVM6_AUSLI|nr:PREDICTED: transcription factor Spi-C-like [Austrofundulus limnaeus]